MTLPSFITIASFEQSCRIAMSSSGSPSDDQDVGALALLDRPAQLLHAQELRPVLRRGDDRLHGREAHVGDEELDVLRVLAVGAPDEAVVASGMTRTPASFSLRIAMQPSSHSSWYSVASMTSGGMPQAPPFSRFEW